MEDTGFYVVGIGASAGGQQAIWDFFDRIPPSPGVAFVVIQHLHRHLESASDRLLAKHTPLPVYWARHDERIESNTVYLLPVNKMMTIENQRFQLRDRRADEVINSAINIFFCALAKDLQQRAIGIIFSGLGSDGSQGVKLIHEYGGTVMVQQPQTAQFNGMPIMAIKADHPDVVLSPGRMAGALMEIVQQAASNN
jgi:two-component system, chemotaxis family, protein-glutamate methylesterase/glutaminase